MTKFSFKNYIKVVLIFCLTIGCAMDKINNDDQFQGTGIVFERGTFKDMGLSPEIEMQIMQDHWELWLEKYRDEPIYMKYVEEGRFTIYNYPVYSYNGTYNNYVVIVIGATTLIDIAYPPITIEDISIQPFFHNLFSIAWKNGKFFGLQELFEQGELTKKDLQNISDEQSRTQDADVQRMLNGGKK